MQTTNTAFESHLLKIVDAEIKSAETAIAAGQLPFEDYKFQCGKLSGMRQVLGYFDEVNKILDER